MDKVSWKKARDLLRFSNLCCEPSRLQQARHETARVWRYRLHGKRRADAPFSDLRAEFEAGACRYIAYFGPYEVDDFWVNFVFAAPRPDSEAIRCVTFGVPCA